MMILIVEKAGTQVGPDLINSDRQSGLDQFVSTWIDLNVFFHHLRRSESM